MKFPYLLLVMILLFTSCSKDEQAIDTQDFSLKEFPQKWKLVKMTGNFQGSETTGQNMSWQENYIFNADGSFLKTRNENGESTSAGGYYSFHEQEQAFILNYNKSNPLIGNCTSESKEYLYFDENKAYLLSNWWACDGPGLFYERIE